MYFPRVGPIRNGRRLKAGLEKSCADMDALVEGLEETEVLYELSDEGSDSETFEEAAKP